jgi:hypothetical protein
MFEEGQAKTNSINLSLIHFPTKSTQRTMYKGSVGTELQETLPHEKFPLWVLFKSFFYESGEQMGFDY